MKNIKENKSIKQKIETLLFELKQMGISRMFIEKELDYSENYITQLLTKGGNEKFYKRLLKYKNDLLQNATNKVKETRIGDDIEIQGDLPNILAQMKEKMMADRAAIKILLVRLADLEAKQAGGGVSSAKVYSLIQKEIEDELRHDFDKGEKIFH